MVAPLPGTAQVGMEAITQDQSDKTGLFKDSAWHRPEDSRRPESQSKLLSIDP